MFIKKDERVQTASRIAIRYTYFFEVLLITVLWMLTIRYNNLILFPPLQLFNSFYICFLINSDISIVASTQFLAMFVSQSIINKQLGGPTKPIVSGTNGFRFMDERERIVSDKAAFITFLYINIFLAIFAIKDIITDSNLGLPLLIVVFQIFSYNIIKMIILQKCGENIS